jgi:hypothetical protein
VKHYVKAQKARLHRLNIRLDQKEWDKVHKLTSNSTCRSVSEYARKVLLEKPVRVFYRNQSFDDFEETMIRVLAQLATFGDNFNLLLKNALSPEKSPDLKPLLPPLLECAKSFARTAEEIRAHVRKLADLCDQKSDLCDQK